jgi:hypothetical protein
LDSTLWRITGASEGDSQFGGTHAGGDLGRGVSPGGVSTGGIYAFDLPGGQRGLGVQSTGGDFTPGSIIRRIPALWPQALDALVVLFDLWVLNDGNRATQIALETAPGMDDFQWQPVPGLQLTTPATSDSLGWEHQFFEATLPLDAASLVDGLALRWLFDDGPGTGGRDEVALAGLAVLGVPSAANEPVPVNAPGTALCLLTALMLTARRRRRLPNVNAPARLA